MDGILHPENVPLGAGVYHLPADVYHSDPAPEPSLSSTVAKKLIGQSPLHAWTACPRLNPDWEPEDKKVFDIGRAAHRVVLGVGDDYVAIPDELLGAGGAVSTKAAKEFVAEARERGLTPLKSAEIDAISHIAASVKRRLSGMGITLHPERSETAAIAQIGGVWNRCMIDNAPADQAQPLWDLKTTTSAAPNDVERTIMNLGYQVQAQHYLDVWKAATGEERSFVFIFVEKEPPFEVTFARIAYGTMVIAQKQIARARDLWRLCLDRNDWPGYPPGIMEIDLPEWWQARWLERESVEADYKRRTGEDIAMLGRYAQSPEGFNGENE